MHRNAKHARACNCIACPQARNTPRPQARNTPAARPFFPPVRRPATATKATTSTKQAAAPPRGERGQDKGTESPQPPPRQRSGFLNPWPFGPHHIPPSPGWVARTDRRGCTLGRGVARGKGPPATERAGGCSVVLRWPGAQNKCFGNNGRPPQGQVPKTPCFVAIPRTP